MSDSLQGRLLGKAAELLGGPRELGHELRVPAANLARWMAGVEPLPRPLFLKTIDLLAELTDRPALAGPDLSCSGDVRRMDHRTKGGERDALH